MSGSNGMDMNGSDASAAAGFNTTTPNWHYTGPAIPQAEASELLAAGNNGPSDIHMAESGCAPSLTAADDIGAVQYVQATSAAVSGYTTPAAAMAAGFEPASPTDYPVVVYVNPAIVAANAAAQRTLDPQHVDGLVYASTPSGGDVLVAAMYILPSTVTKVPMPYGALVQWHRRTQVCGPANPSATMPFDITGFPPCAAGDAGAADALRLLGVAGAGGGRTARHSAAGHSDRGGGGDAAERDIGCIEGMRSDRLIPPPVDSAGVPRSVALRHGGFTRCERAGSGLGAHRLLTCAPPAGMVAGCAGHRLVRGRFPGGRRPAGVHRHQAVPVDEGLRPLPVPRLRQAHDRRCAHRLCGLAGGGAHQLGAALALLPTGHRSDPRPASARMSTFGIRGSRNRPSWCSWRCTWPIALVTYNLLVHVAPVRATQRGPERPAFVEAARRLGASGARWCRPPPAPRRWGARRPRRRWRRSARAWWRRR